MNGFELLFLVNRLLKHRAPHLEVVVEVPLPDGTTGRYPINGVREEGGCLVFRP